MARPLGGPRGPSSQWTLSWREMDSNFRFRASGDTPHRPRRGTGGSQTLRWREVDSNFRFPAMVNLVVVAFVPRGCSGWIGAPGRGVPRFSSIIMRGKPSTMPPHTRG